MRLPRSLEVRALARERGAALCRAFAVPLLDVWTTWAGFSRRQLEADHVATLGLHLCARFPFFHRARGRIFYRDRT